MTQIQDESVCVCGGVPIGGGRIIPVARVSGTIGAAVLLKLRDAGAVLAWIRSGEPGSIDSIPDPESLLDLRSRSALGMVIPVGKPEDIDIYASAAAGYHIPYWHMQNEYLLSALSHSSLPVFLSRHPGCALEEWIKSAEILGSAGNRNIVLVEDGERGIDISSIASLCHKSTFPLLVSPGQYDIKDERPGHIALGAIAAGAHGIILDIPDSSPHELSDRIEQFQRIVLDLGILEIPLERELLRPPSRHIIPSTDTYSANQKKVSRDAVTAPASTGIYPSVGFQGERGAYSEAAMRRYYGEEAVPVPFQSFHEVFVAVLEDRVRYGMIPLENSLAGSVHENYDHFMQFPDIKIIGEVQIRIEHALIAAPGTRLEQIQKVFSHPQGLAQCSRFLQQYPAWERVPFYDTAGSVQYIARNATEGLAAIAGAGAAEVYGMEVLKNGVENNPLNFTRFAVIARLEESDPQDSGKASLVFSTPDTPGALLRCMNVLASCRLNLKKLESRPIFGRPWQYRFYADVEMSGNAGNLDVALKALREEAEDVRLIGCYSVRESDSSEH